jgi:CRISPR-associated endonuclease/helicase Cas3
VERGGHIVAFSNTVRSSQDVADAAVISGLSPDELLLLHSRFMQKHRLADEVILMDRLGARADGRIPRHLLSTTQVGEVSLDYTNDGVITQISPVDSLLQRLGRAGRFERDLPPGRDRLVAKVGIPGGDPTVPFIKPQKYATEGDWSLAVYQEWPILSTQVALLDQCSRRGGRISIPEDVEPLVELVYSSSPDQIMEIVVGLDLSDELTETWRERLFDAHANYLKSKKEADAKAERASIPLELSGADAHVQAIAKRGDEVAYTRLVGDSTQLVLLYSDSDDGGPFFAEEDLSEPCDPDDVDSISTVKMLARNSLRISSDKQLIDALDEVCFPEKWKDHGFLKRYRLAILRRGVAIVKGKQRTYRITYTRQRGLGVER